MKKNSRTDTRISRRKFLQQTSAVGVGSLLPPLTMCSAWAHDIETNSLSFSWHGPVHTRTVNGELVSTRGYNEAFHHNAVAASIPEYVYSPSRVKYPMVRKSYLQDGPGANREARGKEEFVRFSWDKATELIAGELKRVIREHGNASIMTNTSTAYLTSGRINYEGGCMSRFANLMGGFTDCMTDYSTGAAQTLMPHITGSTDVYAQQTSWKTVMEHAEVLHSSTCGACHRAISADEYLANQWIGVMKDMKRNIRHLSKEQYRFLQKYLQLNARDVNPEDHG